MSGLYGLARVPPFRLRREAAAMVASIGKIALPPQGVGYFEKNAVETRLRDPATGPMVVSTFRHDTSRNLDPQLHTHAVITNMVRGEDSKWRTMVDDGLFQGKMAIGAIYRAELAQRLKGLGYGIEKTHADGQPKCANAQILKISSANNGTGRKSLRKTEG